MVELTYIDRTDDGYWDEVMLFNKMSLKEDDGGNQGSFSLNKEWFEEIADKIADILMIEFGIGIIFGRDIFPHNNDCGMLSRGQNYFCWCPSGFATLSNLKSNFARWHYCNFAEIRSTSCKLKLCNNTKKWSWKIIFMNQTIP